METIPPVAYGCVKMVRIVNALEPILRTQCGLGEGCIWDSKNVKFYFVDIVKQRVYTYQPSTGINGYETFAEPISCLALREDGPGLLATGKDSFIYIPESSLPFPPTNSEEPKPFINLTPDLRAAHFGPKTFRFNDGTCDPRGRFFAGTMGHDADKGPFGALYVLEALPAGTKLEDLIYDPDFKGLKWRVELEGVTCNNGTAWVNGGRTVYHTDSHCGEMNVYDYDLDTGKFSNKRLFDLEAPETGSPDGLCVDDNEHVWSARWQKGEILEYSPTAEILTRIKFPKCWNITCCIFGGPERDTLFVTTASSATSGDSVQDRPEGGDTYAITGLGVKGPERGRFRG